MKKIICPGCGAQEDEGIKFCTQCGMALTGEELTVDLPDAQPAEAQYAAPAQAPAATAQPTATAVAEPVAQPVPATEEQRKPTREEKKAEKALAKQTARNASISTWGFVGCILLMGVPVIGWLVAIIWALGGCRKINKRNLARAYLLIAVMMLAVSAILGLIFNKQIKAGLEAAGVSLDTPVVGAAITVTGADALADYIF